jgi:hypothetical protein
MDGNEHTKKTGIQQAGDQKRVCDKNVGAIFLTETYPPLGKGGQGGFAIKA